ncbi:MAG: hypothetical protein IKN43_00735 [Selenomonadaceae bacterium]|nr:hypothetical protein [Selenomonadaceae bacterium]
MTALRQQATTLLNAMPEEKLLQIIQYMQHVYDTPRIKKANRNVDINKLAGSAKNVFGKGVDVDAYIKEMRSDERF